ncbi:cytochrome P450 [Halobacillus sp. Nhm2S1]|uniref:cytochrome P450 family protein n=1 Tax=Halobacillus sp. Nhm2S1 TaxID=2866716 RepID=UPI001C72D6FF|nr:cytochrome P450 [Halobacillus sp. Nhm2S1]MBX0359481.1 cytochrome P450 [Halobacillus sp. Nhm2S1]
MGNMETLQQSNFKTGAYPFYKELREDQPIFSMNSSGTNHSWMITKYNHVKELLKSPSFIKDQSKLFSSSSQDAEQNEFNIFQNMMLDVDPPDHTRLRKLVQPYFNPKTIKQLEPRIREIADDLLNQMKQKETTVDLIDDYAFPLPIIVISEMLGVPAADRDKFRTWSNTIVSASNEMDPDFMDDVEAFTTYLTELFEQRKAEPQDDLVSHLIQTEEDGEQLTRNELYSMIVLLIIAGHETTVNLIGNTLYALFEHPDQLENVKADPTLIPGAIEEGLRYYSPVDFSTARWADEDIDFHGQLIRRGDFILASISSANRDEEKFERASHFDVTRERNAHVAFGFGIHFCLGAPLARLEGKIALEKLLSTFPDIHLNHDVRSPEWRSVFLLRGLDSLPVSW